MPDDNHTVTLQLSNARAIPLTVVLEPWGDEYPLAPGATFDIHAHGPAGGTLQVESGNTYIAVYAWPGSVVSLFHNGINIGGPERQPVPPIPTGSSVHGFIQAMFGRRPQS
jgi:hypothetical protein